MSRIGKKIIAIPDGVTVQISGEGVCVKGPKGTLNKTFSSDVVLSNDGKNITVAMKSLKSKPERSLWGTARTLLQNMIVGVTDGFTRSLEVNGVGYKVAVSGKGLKLDVGYSHPVDFPLPESVKALVDKNIITLTSPNKELLGNIASEIRGIRKPEPYKGKGIKYSEEILRRKAGKAAKSAA
ncbi:MAG: 50S ribosomal protein L6 [Patescibacteria group bacterium]